MGTSDSFFFFCFLIRVQGLLVFLSLESGKLVCHPDVQLVSTLNEYLPQLLADPMSNLGSIPV